MTAGNGERRNVAGEKAGHGLVIYRASRLEALLGPLRQLLAATQPDNVLAPHTIIAAHAGMKQWLSGALAREYGVEGIAANLDILLPSAFIDRLAQQRLGQRAVALPHYARQRLRWIIHAALADVDAQRMTDPRIAAYLREGDAEVAQRRFQLADRLAGLYSRYLVYRPDWLLAWEKGNYHAAARDRVEVTENALLAPLWRHVRKRLGAHRADVVGELIAALQRDDEQRADDTLHVFGVSHLAPSELVVLRAYARRRLVAMYVPDPCREYWGGLARELGDLREQRRQESERIEQTEEDGWTEQAHPLLASWGHLGQQFMLTLAGEDGDVLEDVRHWRDERSEPPPHRLSRVQQSIRELDTRLLQVDLSSEVSIKRELDDASLRVHACHTRLRELEVLRDQLFDALESSKAAGAPIKPSEIVVMAPNIHAYVPLIASVFGVAGDARERLPYHLADVAVWRSHALFSVFRRLLAVPATRITAPEVMDLLAVPEIARRLDLDADDVDELGEWLARSRVAWALDPAYRQRFGAPPIAAHTFGWALDRLLAGYVMATVSSDERQPGVRLADGSELAPLTSICGPAAEHIGALEQLLEQLQAICDLSNQILPASAWAVELERRCEALFRIDPGDRDAREAKALLLRSVRSIATEPGEVGEDPRLHFTVVRDLLLERLDAAPERQRFLLGGITFCGMIPQRAIPFKVVAVLGLNDGEYPRSASDGGLDLMARYRRLGDRDVRSDDRYLFLETLMSARERLHLSYIGESVRDGQPRNPAAPLGELLDALDRAAALDGDKERDRPWYVKHPLQPFDARYFHASDDGDPRLFSYDAHFAAMRGAGRKAAVAPFLDADDGNAQSIELPQPIAIKELRDYYKDPARQVLQRRLQVSLEALADDRLPDHEPLEAKFAAIEKVSERLFFSDVLPVNQVPEQPPPWLRLGGIVPPGQPGQVAWAQERAAAAAMLEQTRALFAGHPPPQSSHEIDLVLGSHRLTGQIERVFKSQADGRDCWVLLRVLVKNGELRAEKELHFKYRVPLFLDWALLRLQSVSLPAAIRLQALTDPGERPWQDSINRWDHAFVHANEDRRETMRDELEQRVTRLLDWWIAAQDTPRWYFPAAAWETLKSAGAGVGTKWVAENANATGERDYAPGYSRLLAGAVDFREGSSELAALHAFALQLDDCITLAAASAVTA